MPPLFGLAPGGVYRAGDVAAPAVRSCRTLSTLPAQRQAVSFLWHYPSKGEPFGRALPGTVVPWSPDFPRRVETRRGRPALWPARYGLLRPGKQQREKLGPAFAVDNAVDQVRPEAALEGNRRLLSVGDVIAEAFERKMKGSVGPVRVD